MSELAVASYLSAGGSRVHVMGTHEELRELWDKMSQPLRETAIIRDATHEDMDRGVRTWQVPTRSKGWGRSRVDGVVSLDLAG